MDRGKMTQRIVQTMMVFGIIIALNVIAQYVYTYFDLTEEKRFTLTSSTSELIESIEDNIYIEIMLDGEFPAGFKRLQSSTIELLDQFRSINPLIDYELYDPSEGTVKEINGIREQLRIKGVTPTNLMVRDGDKMTERLIYPWAIVKLGSKDIAVNLLEAEIPGDSKEVTLNNSVSLLEYKLTNAIHKLIAPEKKNIVFTQGQGELEDIQIAKLMEELRPSYDVGRLNLDSIFQIESSAHLLIIPKPRFAFSERDQFIIDQYIMNGGKVIWLIDQFEVNLDSINIHKMYVPNPIEHKLDNLLFNYGVRINQDLALDIENTRIPQVIGMEGGKAQTSLFPWYYHVFSAPKDDHPIVKNLDRVNLLFPSTIDTIETKTPIKKSIVLSTSDYSRKQIYPMRINFEILRVEPDMNAFSKRQMPLGVLLEGEFQSFYKNRVTKEMEEGLNKIEASFKDKSSPTKQLVVSDGDFIKNMYNPQNSTISPIGYNPWEQKVYNGNKDFIFNAIEYLLDDYGLIQARAKDVRLRLLNKVKTQKEKLKWQLINILLPLLFILIFGLFYNYRRRIKFGKRS